MPVSGKNELFCFHIQQFNTPDYLEKFISELSNHLPEFVFSHEVLANEQRKIDKGLTKKSLVESARGFLQKTAKHRTFDSGDLAEFLMYLFAKKVKGAHKLLTRVHKREAIKKAQVGRDSSYVYKADDGSIYMLLGEAKAKPDANDGLREAQQDMNMFWDSGNILHEVRLASTHLRFEMNDENADIYEAFFIEDNEIHKKLDYANLILVAYSMEKFKDLITQSIKYKDFEIEIQKNLERCFKNQTKLINSSKYKSIYCFIPFECINKARNTFAAINNLTIDEQ